MTKAKRNQLLIAIAFIGLIAFIIYSTAGLAEVRCEVCMEFRGQTACKPAYGTSRNEAVSTATVVACSELASGRDDSIQCTQLTRPQRVTCSGD